MQLDNENIRNLIQRFSENYFFDRMEFGEVLTVASAAILVVSLNSALLMQNSLEEVKDVNQEFEELDAIMSTDNFQSSMEALETTAVEISQDFQRVYTGFQALNSSTESVSQLEKNLENRYEFYRWLILISLLGIVAGISLIYI